MSDADIARAHYDDMDELSEFAVANADALAALDRKARIERPHDQSARRADAFSTREE